jgi:hypothetical protein
MSRPLPPRHPESKVGAALLIAAGLMAVPFAVLDSPWWLILVIASWTVALWLLLERHGG